MAGQLLNHLSPRIYELCGYHAIKFFPQVNKSMVQSMQKCYILQQEKRRPNRINKKGKEK